MTADEFIPPVGVAEQLAVGVRRILAPNPSAMTYWGTNTYVLGDAEVLVIDPGPQAAPHLTAILASIGTARVAGVLVTHSHLDHAPLARDLADATGAKIFAYGPSSRGRSAVMARLAASGVMGGGEGVDPDFAPDVVLNDGDHIMLEGAPVKAWYTPGHFCNHLCFSWRDMLFSGDHIMDWATSLISPPDGDLTQYMQSLDHIDRPWDIAFPGHGAPIQAPQARIKELRQHRIARQSQVRAALGPTAKTADQITREIYTDVDPLLWPIATRNTLANLIDLTEKNQAETAEPLSENSGFWKKT